MRYKEKVNDNIDPTYYKTLAMIESSGNPKAQAKTSSAAGLYQFTKGTWKSMINQMGLDYSLEDRFDPKKSKRVVEEFTKQNYKYLKGKLRREVSPAELYLAHFLGMGGSNNLLSAYDKNPNQTVDKVLQGNQLTANRGVFYNKDGSVKKIKDIYKWANKKFGIKPEEYDFHNDPQELFTEENTIDNKEKSLDYYKTDEPLDYTTPMYAADVPIFNFPESEEEIEEPTQVVEAKAQIDNRQQILQQLMTANAVQYIDPNESADPEPNSYGYPNQYQKGGNTKKKSEDDYGVMDFAKDAYEAWFNPKNYGVDDYSDKGEFGDAYKKARQDGKKEFMYKNRRFNTNYDGTPSEQLKETGITDDQLQGDNFIREKLSKNLSPKGYDDKASRVWQALISDEVPQDRREFEKVANGNRENGAANWEVEWNQKRLDAHNLYTGKPQQYGTFSVSKHKPTKAKDKDALYYSVTSPQLKVHIKNHFNDDGTLKTNMPMDDSGVMGNYTLEQGEDENGKYVSYYDKWDIAPADYGKPMEIYDRIYYDENPNSISAYEWEEEVSKLKEEERRIYETYKDKDGNLPKKYSDKILELWGKADELRGKVGNKIQLR